MFTDYVLDGQAVGEVGEQMAACRYEPNLLRPWKGRDGKNYITVNSGRLDDDGKPKYTARLVTDLIQNGYNIPVANATTLRKDEWIRMDQNVIKAARSRLRAWSDLAAVSSYGGFNGMSKMVLEHETTSDPGEAVVDMDGLTPGRTDAPKYQLEGLPLPITHSDFWFSSRRLAVSRNSGMPLDTTMAEAAGRRVAEEIEKVLIGMTQYDWAYGSTSDYGSSAGKIWGYTNHPDRITKTDVTVPDGTNGATTVDDVLAMIELASNSYHYGPFMLYHSTDWDKYLDDDYRANDSRTLRQRLRQISQISDVRRLDYLTNTYTFLLVEMIPETARAVTGMDITTVQWESQGGMRVNFKVMAIMVPQLRSDFNGNMGIVHATTA